MKKTLFFLLCLWAFNLHAQEDYCTCDDPTSKFYALSQMMEVMQGKITQETETNYDNFTTSLDLLPVEEYKPFKIDLEELIKEEPSLKEEKVQEIKVELEEEPFLEEKDESILKEQKKLEREIEEDAQNRHYAPRKKKKRNLWTVRLKSPKRSGKYKGKCPNF